MSVLLKYLIADLPAGQRPSTGIVDGRGLSAIVRRGIQHHELLTRLESAEFTKLSSECHSLVKKKRGVVKANMD